MAQLRNRRCRWCGQTYRGASDSYACGMCPTHRFERIDIFRDKEQEVVDRVRNNDHAQEMERLVAAR